MPPRKKLSILCFGDSLTSGFFCYGMDSHPYSLKLEDRLTGAMPDVDFDVVTDGLPGDVASFERFLNRIKRQFEKRSFDWVVILGGTNDLGYGIDVETIYGGLQNVWDVPLTHGTKVLALTVPETEHKSQRLDRRRAELNESIMTHQIDNYHAFDLHTHIPFHSLSEADREEYWDDGLHLRDDGYDWMGDHIATALLQLLKNEDGLAGTARNTGKSPKTSLTFEEETGNPRNISEGYVVVRKRDLE